MNHLSKKDQIERFDEIVLPNDSLKYMNKSAVANIQIVEFNRQGTMIALGCKNATILIVDFFTMGIVRVFSLHQDYGLPANEDVDQFYPFRKFINYFDDDFIYKQKPAESQKDAEAFLEQKYAARKAAAIDDGSYIEPKMMKLESKESKNSTLAKGAIANIDWSLDSSRIVVCFKQHNQIVVWDVVTTQRII